MKNRLMGIGAAALAAVILNGCASNNDPQHFQGAPPKTVDPVTGEERWELPNVPERRDSPSLREFPRREGPGTHTY